MPQPRVRQMMQKEDPEGTVTRWMNTVKRRVYSVSGPNALLLAHRWQPQVDKVLSYFIYWHIFHFVGDHRQPRKNISGSEIFNEFS